MRTRKTGRGAQRKEGSANVLKCLLFSLLVFLCFCGDLLRSNALANEVIPETAGEVIVREHPKTGLPYVSILDPQKDREIFKGDMKKYNRPDYRMLDPKVKPGDLHYDGPVSDRKKIYILAGALAAGGVAGYAALPAAAAGGGAATGAGAYAAAGAAVTAGTFSTHWAMKQDDRPDDFTQVSISREIPL